MGFSCVPNYKILEKIFGCSNSIYTICNLTRGWVIAVFHRLSTGVDKGVDKLSTGEGVVDKL
jgi:hypothetical protein